MNGFSAEEFEPDAVDDTAGDTSDTTAKVDGAGDIGSTRGNGNTNAGSAPGETLETPPVAPAATAPAKTTTGRCSGPPPITALPAKS